MHAEHQIDERRWEERRIVSAHIHRMTKSNISTYFHTDTTHSISCRFHIWFWLPFLHACHFYNSLSAIATVFSSVSFHGCERSSRGWKAKAIFCCRFYEGMEEAELVNAAAILHSIHSMVVFVQRNATALDEERMKRSHIESQSEMKSAPQWLETLWIWSRRAIPFCDLG